MLPDAPSLLVHGARSHALARLLLQLMYKTQKGPSDLQASENPSGRIRQPIQCLPGVHGNTL